MVQGGNDEAPAVPPMLVRLRRFRHMPARCEGTALNLKNGALPGRPKRYRAVALAVVGSILTTSGWAQQDWIHALEGRWVGERSRLTIDQGAQQANRDPDKPFEWQSMRIVSATGSMVVFQIGDDRFVGKFGNGTLILTRVGHVGYDILTRVGPWP